MARDGDDTLGKISSFNRPGGSTRTFILIEKCPISGLRMNLGQRW